MAIYRTVNTSFWTDTKVSDDFTPEDKYFMLYCLTNNFTNLCGCYEISIKQMSKDLGYEIETIEKLLRRFTEVHQVISYNKENKELLIRNWHKYNWTKSQKLDKPLLKEIENIKTKEYQVFVAKEYNKRDSVSIPYVYTMDTTVSVTVSDSNTNLIKIYEEEIGHLTPYGLEVINGYLKELPEDMVIRAIQIASSRNCKSLKYIEGILKNWINCGYKVLSDVKEEKRMSDTEKRLRETLTDTNLDELYDN